MITKPHHKMPNFIFIVADDLGYADLGCYGGREANFGEVSPNIDRLAEAGIKFTQGYSNSPVCSPTRFALLSGRYQYYFRGAAEEPLGSKTRESQTLGFPVDHPTLPSILKGAGYTSALMGKWHLGYPPTFGPLKSGYDEFFGPMAGGVDYFTHCDVNGRPDLFFEDHEKSEEGYLTDLISKHSVDFINRMSVSGDPFLLSVHYTAPHWPWETRDDKRLSGDVKDNLFHLHGGDINTYKRMIHHMDEGIGWIVDALKKTGQLENTLIIFTSDNGGERFSDNWPLVGGKMDLTEGGIRVPWVAHWPSVIKPGSISKQLCMSMDWTATILDVAGIKDVSDYLIDGISLLPILKDPKSIFSRPLFWRMSFRNQRAYRLDSWKYLKIDDDEYLFNLSIDERERANLKDKDLIKFNFMKEAWINWNKTIPQVDYSVNISVGLPLSAMPQR
jgi:arylsulfatase A-like enzyme